MTDEELHEAFNTCERILLGLYDIRKKDAYNSVVAAFAEVGGIIRNWPPDKGTPYLLQASKYRLYEEWRKNGLEHHNPIEFDEAFMEPTPPENVEIRRMDQVVNKLKKKLTTAQWQLFCDLQAGKELTAIAEEKECSYQNVLQRKRTLLNRCQEILGLI